MPIQPPAYLHEMLENIRSMDTFLDPIAPAHPFSNLAICMEASEATLTEYGLSTFYWTRNHFLNDNLIFKLTRLREFIHNKFKIAPISHKANTPTCRTDRGLNHGWEKGPTVQLGSGVDDFRLWLRQPQFHQESRKCSLTESSDIAFKVGQCNPCKWREQSLNFG